MRGYNSQGVVTLENKNAHWRTKVERTHCLTFNFEQSSSFDKDSPLYE